MIIRMTWDDGDDDDDDRNEDDVDDDAEYLSIAFQYYVDDAGCWMMDNDYGDTCGVKHCKQTLCRL